MSNEQQHEKYYVPEQSRWPIIGAIALFVTAFGGANFIHHSTGLHNTGSVFEGLGPYIFMVGLTIVFFMMYGWWRDTVKESMGGLYSTQMDRSFRQGMMWFITSEVMFFAAFFGALFYARTFVMPWLGGEGNNVMTHELLWPDFIPAWPVNPTPDGRTFETIGAWGLPAINTAILLTSSWTLTMAHHALKDNERGKLLTYMIVTVLLGVTFLCLQAWEYHHAYTELGLTLGSGIYGSTFFMLTGFHGMHVTVGTIFLIVLTLRIMRGHFKPENHFAFEAGAWYWHFVDVVWLFLFIFVYIL